MRGATLLVAGAIATALTLSIVAGTLPPAYGLLAVSVVVTAILWHIRAHLASIMLVFFAVLLATVVAGQRWPKLLVDRIEVHESDSLARTWASSGQFDEDLPIVLHLVFDEMMSTGAISDDLPGGLAASDAFRTLAATHGLRLFDSVYSRYFFSGESLPNMMNPEYEGRTRLSEVFTDQQSDHASNAYFDDLAARGYRTAVFQTTLMGFCANSQVDMCETFDSYDPGGDESDGLDIRNRTVALWQTLLRAYEPSYLSNIGQKLLGRLYGLGTRQVGVLGIADRYDVQRFPSWFDRFAGFAARVPRGTHLFAHFMVPHAPYLLTENCFVSGRFEAGYYLARHSTDGLDERRRQYYGSYLAQLRCVQQKLDDLLTALGRSENFRDALIVIHGDHGSRISSGDILEGYSPQDFVDNYATFFAIKAPAVTAGVDCEFISLPEVFRRYMTGQGKSVASTRNRPLPVVVVSRAAGNAKVEVPMPPFGCDSNGPDEH